MIQCTKAKIEEEERRAREYDSYMRYARMLSKEALREAYVELMIAPQGNLNMMQTDPWLKKGLTQRRYIEQATVLDIKRDTWRWCIDLPRRYSIGGRK